MEATDRELGMHCRITRRDLFPQDRTGYDPPLLDGLHGSHPGAYESAHLLRDGTFPSSAPADRASHSAKILILDQHGDFGGYANGAAYTEPAIDQAHRAVQELLSM